MKFSNHCVLIAAAALLTTSFAWSLSRGPINPPSEIVAPTNRTLSEIYDKIAFLENSNSCECGPWQSAVTQHAINAITNVTQGNGLLHAIILPEGRQLEIYSNNGTKLIANLRCTEQQNSVKFILNVNYQNGLSYKSGSTGYETSECTLLFRPM